MYDLDLYLLIFFFFFLLHPLLLLCTTTIVNGVYCGNRSFLHVCMKNWWLVYIKGTKTQRIKPSSSTSDAWWYFWVSRVTTRRRLWLWRGGVCVCCVCACAAGWGRVGCGGVMLRVSSPLPPLQCNFPRRTNVPGQMKRILPGASAPWSGGGARAPPTE